MKDSGAEFVIKIDPEAAEVFRGLSGRIDKMIEIMERMEKTVIIPADLELTAAPRCANWERLPDIPSPNDASTHRG